MTLQERDQKHIWHPLTQHKTHTSNIAITKAKGAILEDENGKKYITKTFAPPPPSKKRSKLTTEKY